MGPGRRDQLDRQQWRKVRLVEENVAQSLFGQLAGGEDVDGEGAIGSDESVEDHVTIESSPAGHVEMLPL
jgi:hypothetical protein